MECRPAAFLALLTLLASGEGASAQVPDPAPPDVKAETLRLIQADFQRVAQAAPQGSAAAPTRADPDVVKLSPFIVTDKEIPAVIFPHYETRLHRFLREGTLYQKGAWMLQATFLPTQRPIGSTAKPGARFELSASLRF